MLPPPPIERGFFGASAEGVTSGEMALRLSGNADMNIRPDLHAFLLDVHGTATAAKIVDVTVDCRALEFMNSSCLQSVAFWIQQVLEVPEERRYRVKFLASSKRFWQRRSLSAIARFADGTVEIEYS